jgi:hypothetical protein
MCNDCFIIEYKSFLSEKEWLDFDLKLTQKLSSGKMKYVKFIADWKRGKDDGEYIYFCQSCNQKWKLRDYLDSSGYFIKSKMEIKGLSRFFKLFLKS